MRRHDAPSFDFDHEADPPLRRHEADPPVSRHELAEAAAWTAYTENRDAVRAIVTLCLRVQAAGRRHWSINAAFEVIRANPTITTTGLTYKLNNNHRAYWARWIMQDYPELDGFFGTREQGRIPQAYDK